MDVVAAFRSVGTFRGAAAMCGVDPKTVKRIVVAHEAGELDEERAVRVAGYTGSPRNFRRLVAEVKRAWRAAKGRQHRRRPVWVVVEVQ